jgi:hypothetical protein
MRFAGRVRLTISFLKNRWPSNPKRLHKPTFLSAKAHLAKVRAVGFGCPVIEASLMLKATSNEEYIVSIKSHHLDLALFAHLMV